jgi:hypothetical protein
MGARERGRRRRELKRWRRRSEEKEEEVVEMRYSLLVSFQRFEMHA